jgi:hypothetical protein
MSTATLRTGGSRDRSAQDDASGGARRWTAIVAGIALVLVVVAWLLGWLRFGTDPRVREILTLQEDARQKYAATGGPRTVAEATEAFTAMTEIRGKIEALPAHLRPEVERAGGNVFRSAFRARIDEYLNAPPAERNAVLDRQIDQEEMMRKAFEAGRAALNAVGATPAGGSPAGGNAAGGNAAGGSSAAPGGRARGGTQEDGNRWRKGMIDRTTPEQRARYVEYRRAMDKRREERGLPSGWSR